MHSHCRSAQLIIQGVPIKKQGRRLIENKETIHNINLKTHPIDQIKKYRQSIEKNDISKTNRIRHRQEDTVPASFGALSSTDSTNTVAPLTIEVPLLIKK